MSKITHVVLGLSSMLGILISVAFMILLERKVLGYIQFRKGPNKSSIFGLLQSFSDAIKLFLKEQFFPLTSNYWIYFLSPLLMLFIILYMWMVMPFNTNCMNFFLGGLFFLSCSSLSVYSLIMSGWSSNSNYSLIGAMRGIAQMISYEVSMFFFLLALFIIMGSYKLMSLYYNQFDFMYAYMFLPIMLCWMTISLAETNRTPFDFAEGESELVSGFNVEYMSGGFALLFLSEYASIIFMSFFFIFLFFSGTGNKILLLSLMGSLFCFLFIWIRGCFPRYRYDKLMSVAWKIFLPLSLFFMNLFMVIKFFSN